MTTGQFITVEGSEGVGKTTNLNHIRQQLLAAGVEVVETREPGGTPLGEELRELWFCNRCLWAAAFIRRIQPLLHYMRTSLESSVITHHGANFLVS